MQDIIMYSVAGVTAFLVVLLLALKLRKKKDAKDGVEKIGGVRYTTTSETTQPQSETEENFDVKISYNKRDILIPVKVEMTVGKDADILPGKYTILTTVQNKTQLNIRIGGYVRIYSHNSEIVLAEGDKIMPLSVGIILR